MKVKKFAYFKLRWLSAKSGKGFLNYNCFVVLFSFIRYLSSIALSLILHPLSFIPRFATYPSSLIFYPLSFILAFFSLSPLYAGDWPAFRHDGARTGYAKEQAYPPLSFSWEFQTQGDVISSPVVANGIVYVGARSGSVYALNARTGALIWDYSTGGWVDATPAVSSGTLYVSSRDGNLYALNALTGDVLWQADLGGPSNSSPLVYDGRVYVGVSAPPKKVKVYNAYSGAFLWEYPVGQPVFSSPSTDGAGIFFGSTNGRMYAYQVSGPAQLWSYQTIGSFNGLGALPVADSVVYGVPGNDEKKVFAVNSATGNQLSTSAVLGSETESSYVTSPVLGRGKLIVGAGTLPHYLYGLGSQALNDAWGNTASLGDMSALGFPASPAMANDILYVGTADNRFLAVGISTGGVFQEIAISTASHSSPAVSNGMVYFGILGGKLLAYKSALVSSISSPVDDEIVTGTVSVRAYIANPAMTGYTLGYGPGAAPSSWTLIVSSTTGQGTEGGIIGNWPTVNINDGVYTLRLMLEPSGGIDNTAFSTIRVNSPPEPPTALTAQDVPDDHGNKIQLNWIKSPQDGGGSDDVTAYRIYRSSPGGGEALLGSASAGSSGWVDSTAVTAATFTYSAAAWDGYTESVRSDTAQAFSVNNNPASDNDAPSAVSDLTVSPGNAGGHVALSWAAPGDDGAVGTASYYVIRYSSSASFDWGNDFDKAALWKANRAVSGPSGTLETEDVSGLFGGVTYYFVIKSADDIPNLSAVSNVSSGCAQVDYVPPGAPSALSVADTPDDHGGSLTLSWTLSADDGAGAGDVYGYKIFRDRVSAAYVSSAPLAEVSKGSTVYMDASTADNARYYYAVKAFDSSNDSPYSNESYGISADNWKFLDSSQGGSVTLADGASVEIPKEASSQNDNIIMRREPDPVYLSYEVPRDSRGTDIIYEVKFEKPATRLVKPANMTLPYTAAAVAGMKEENLRLYTWTGRWSMINTSRAVPGEKKVTAEVSHFSVFRVMEYIPSGILLDKNSVYTYPNPARGDTLTFKFLVADKADVYVSVYNVAGEKVAVLEKKSCPAGVTSEIVWEIGHIASGVYQYRVEAVNASDTRSVMKRLAIIH